VSTGQAAHDLPLGRGVSVLARDAQGLVAFNKPAGVVASQPSGRGSARVAAGEVRPQRGVFRVDGGKRGRASALALEPARFGDLGVILAADSAELAVTVRAQFKRKTVRKVYAALVFGVPKLPQETWRDRLAVQKQGGVIRTSAAAGHVPAESVMTAVRSGRGESRVSLIRLEPRTGRSHQLRVQCAKRQLPIVGDQTYGDFKRNREFARAADTKRLFLHSEATRFEYEFRGRTATFAAEAPLPEEFTAALLA
jgi:hypothetical protein